jgi:hypothetical protein
MHIPMPGGWRMSMMDAHARPDLAGRRDGVCRHVAGQMVSTMLPALVSMRGAIAAPSATAVGMPMPAGASSVRLPSAGAPVPGAARPTSLEMQRCHCSRGRNDRRGPDLRHTVQRIESASPGFCRECRSSCEALAPTCLAWNTGCLPRTALLLHQSSLPLVVGSWIWARWRACGAITERLAPGGLRVARFIGVVLVAAGLYLIAHAALG